MGSDQWGANLRYASYSANDLNQYASRTVPAAVDIIGTATNTATVTVNNFASYRHGNYYRVQLPMTNTLSAVYQTVTNLAVLNVGTSFVIQTNIIGSEYLPQTPESYAYDADGNLTNDGHWLYTWDGENRLITMTNNNPVGPQMGLAFVYDSKSRRIGKTVATATNTNSVTFVYDGWNLIDEITSNSIVRSYMWGLDRSGTLQNAGGVNGLLKLSYYTNEYFLTYDGNGNVTSLDSAALGTVFASYEYGPFGELIKSFGTMAKINPFRFSTKYQDNETDLLYFGYRFLCASSGRWLNKDPMEEKASANVYAFIANSPITYIDILGLSCDASYSFDEDPWWEYLAYVKGTRWVKTMAEIKTDMIKKLRSGCCCFPKVYFSQHGGVPANLILGDQSINPYLIKMLENAVNQSQQRAAADRTKHLKQFLKFVAHFMCKPGTVTFVQCESGAGPDGKVLQDWLNHIFGNNATVVLFSGEVKWFYGSPKCVSGTQ